MIRPPVVLVIILVGLSRYFQTGSCENSALEDGIKILSAELGIPEWKVRKFLNVMKQQQPGNVRIIRSKYFKVVYRKVILLDICDYFLLPNWCRKSIFFLKIKLLKVTKSKEIKLQHEIDS